MKKPSFELVPTPEFRAEIERIASQYEGFKRVGIYGFPDTGTLVIQAKHHYKGQVVSTWAEARGNAPLEDRVATLTTRFYNELVKTFEPDFIPVENF